MRLHLFVFAATFALAACATSSSGSDDAVADAPAPEAPADTAPASTAPLPPVVELCDENDVKDFVGKQSTDDVVEQARVASGAKTTRVIPPNSPVTMDYRGDRLNVNTDADGKIQSLSCG
jgi:hypothetical protein